MTMPSGNMGAAQPPLNQPAPSAMGGALAQHWWTLVLRGVIALIFGAMAFVTPVAVMFSLAVLFAAYLIVDGLIGLFAAFRTSHADNRWWFLLAEAVLSLLMGVLALMFPGGAILAFVVVTAVWALLSGGFLLAAAFRLGLSHGRFLARHRRPRVDPLGRAADRRAVHGRRGADLVGRRLCGAVRRRSHRRRIEIAKTRAF